MFAKCTRIATYARHLAIASVSLLLVASAVGYALSPVSDALAASVTAVTAASHHESVEGKLQGKYVSGVTVRVEKRVKGHVVVVGTRTVGHSGRFNVPVTPGKYEVVISKGHKHVTKQVKVARNHAEFIVVKVSKTHGGFGIAPVIFNY